MQNNLALKGSGMLVTSDAGAPPDQLTEQIKEQTGYETGLRPMPGVLAPEKGFDGKTPPAAAFELLLPFDAEKSTVEKALSAITGWRSRQLANLQVFRDPFGYFLTLHPNERNAPVRFDREEIGPDSLFEYVEYFNSGAEPTVTGGQFTASNGNLVYVENRNSTLRRLYANLNITYQDPSLMDQTRFHTHVLDYGWSRFAFQHVLGGWLQRDVFNPGAVASNVSFPGQSHAFEMFRLRRVALYSQSARAYVALIPGTNLELRASHTAVAPDSTFYMIESTDFQQSRKVAFIASNWALMTTLKYDLRNAFPVMVRAELPVLHESEWFTLTSVPGNAHRIATPAGQYLDIDTRQYAGNLLIRNTQAENFIIEYL